MVPYRNDYCKTNSAKLTIYLTNTNCGMMVFTVLCEGSASNYHANESQDVISIFSYFDTIQGFDQKL